jgi:hypothetical protein
MLREEQEKGSHVNGRRRAGDALEAGSIVVILNVVKDIGGGDETIKSGAQGQASPWVASCRFTNQQGQEAPGEAFIRPKQLP